MADGFTLTQIEAHDINDAWAQCVRKCVDTGYVYDITSGSYAGQQRKSFDFITGIIRNPGNRPLQILIPDGSSLPSPNDEDYIINYFSTYLMSPEISKNEDYTYGERLVEPKIRGLEKTLYSDIKELELDKKTEERIMERLKVIEFQYNSDEDTRINPVEDLINKYVNGGFGTNQATLEIAMPTDILLADPPCLRLIDTRIRYKQMHFQVYFRSWDLVGGFPSNLAAIQLMKEYVVDQINEKMNEKQGGCFPDTDNPELKDGTIIFTSKGLHIYDHQWDYANILLGKKTQKKE